jgi:hypothetical protein
MNMHRKTIAALFFITAVLVPLLALAGDDYLGASFDVTTNTSTSACGPTLRPKVNYAFRCTTDTYIRVTSDTTNAGASAKDQIATANKLIDLPTTASQTNFCALAVTAAGSCYTYIHREKGE